MEIDLKIRNVKNIKRQIYLSRLIRDFMLLSVKMAVVKAL